MDDVTTRPKAKPKSRAKAPSAALPRRVGVEISGRLDAALERLAAMTGKPKSLHLRKAIEKYVEDTYDILLADKSRKESGERISLDELKKRLGMAD